MHRKELPLRRRVGMARCSEMRLIDADMAREDMLFEMCGTGYQYNAMSVIDRQPTVDAVEVVRCKDCKYSTPDIMSEDYRACWERNTVMPMMASAPTENARR